MKIGKVSETFSNKKQMRDALIFFFIVPVQKILECDLMTSEITTFSVIVIGTQLSHQTYIIADKLILK